jgi:hypothetical protein
VTRRNTGRRGRALIGWTVVRNREGSLYSKHVATPAAANEDLLAMHSYECMSRGICVWRVA